MTITRKITLAALLAPAIVVGAAYAAQPGPYIGASGGQTTVDQDAKDLGLDGSDFSDFNIDDDDAGWKVFVGYQYLHWLGFEASYVDFGGVSNSRTINNTQFETDVDLTGWDGFMVGTLPIGPVDLFAKVGGISLNVDGDVKVNGNKQSNSESDTQFAYGVGAAYNFGRGHWGLRVEAEGFDDNEVDDFYFLSAGLTYRFFSDPVAPVVVAAAPVPVAEPTQCVDDDADGVCDAVDECLNTPHGVRVDSIGCDCDYSLQLQFAFDSAKLSAMDMQELDKLVSGLKDGKLASISGVVDGFTDSVGTDSYNLGLSKRRAESVVNYLQSRGVNVGSQFTVNGYGEANPVASNETEEGRAQNRRVVVRRTDCAN